MQVIMRIIGAYYVQSESFMDKTLHTSGLTFTMGASKFRERFCGIGIGRYRMLP